MMTLAQEIVSDMRRFCAFDDAFRSTDVEKHLVESIAKLLEDHLSQPHPVAQGEAIGEVRENGVNWYGPNPHAFPMGTKFYTSAPTIPTGHRVVPEVATFATERAALVAKIGDCCISGDPLCAAGCLVEKAAKKNAERGAYSAASTRLSVVPDAKVSEPDDHPDAGLYIKGWNDCRDALLAASPSAGGV